MSDSVIKSIETQPDGSNVLRYSSGEVYTQTTDGDIYKDGEIYWVAPLGDGKMITYDNATREIWRAPEMNAAETPSLDGWSFGIIFAWAIVAMAFLSDFCWGRMRKSRLRWLGIQ